MYVEPKINLIESPRTKELEFLTRGNQLDRFR